MDCYEDALHAAPPDLMTLPRAGTRKLRSSRYSFVWLAPAGLSFG